MWRVDPVGLADAVRARVPDVLRTYGETRTQILEGGIVESSLKLLCARYLAEDEEVLVFEGDDRYSDRERAALRWTHTVAWAPDLADDELWSNLHAEFSEPELVELGYYIAIVHGQLHWLRTLGIRPAREQLPGP